MTNRTITDRIFGIEIEFFGVDHRVLASAIRDKGVECHVENYNHLTRSHWKIVTDSSLSGRNSGEVVSPKLQGQAGFSQLQKVCQALNEMRAQVNRTCGVHVHLNSTDMSIEQIINVFDRYADAEAEIDAMMPRSRRNSRWCANCVKGTFRNHNTKRSVAGGAGRYYKVNLTNIAERGSIEFRQHSGTTEFVKIANWISILMQFVEASNNLLNTSGSARRIPNVWYARPRNLIERNGYKVTSRPFTPLWDIKKDGETVASVHNSWFEGFYPDNASDSQLKKGAYDFDKLIFEAGLLGLEVGLNPEPEEVTDQGLTHGLDDNAREWIEQRQNNFFEG